ncbi:general secretion pathway protein GspG [Mangrovibacter sp. MFB070]|nr:general secretion pathway protein GspG [Mangrovibacter sp. MFB070]
MSSQRQRGFTLLEIMVVVVILGVLASLTVPGLMGNKDRADRQKAVSDITAIENALEMYRLDNGIYPSTEQGLRALVKEPAIAPLPRNYRQEGYLRRLSNDPWGNPYQYRHPGQHGLVDIWSWGMEGENSQNLIGNWDADE